MQQRFPFSCNWLTRHARKKWTWLRCILRHALLSQAYMFQSYWLYQTPPIFKHKCDWLMKIIFSPVLSFSTTLMYWRRSSPFRWAGSSDTLTRYAGVRSLAKVRCQRQQLEGHRTAPPCHSRPALEEEGEGYWLWKIAAEENSRTWWKEQVGKERKNKWMKNWEGKIETFIKRKKEVNVPILPNLHISIIFHRWNSEIAAMYWEAAKEAIRTSIVLLSYIANLKWLFLELHAGKQR